jgi:hypothetical protein
MYLKDKAKGFVLMGGGGSSCPVMLSCKVNEIA